MRTWRHLVIADEEGIAYRSIIIPAELVDVQLERFRTKVAEFTVLRNEDVSEAEIDLPGMIYTGRKWAGFQIENLKVSIPVSDARVFLAELSADEGKVRGGVRTYTMAGAFGRFIVLTEVDREALLDAMEAQADEFDRLAAEEDAEWKLRMKNLSGKVVSARYNSKDIGQA